MKSAKAAVNNGRQSRAGGQTCDDMTRQSARLLAGVGLLAVMISLLIPACSAPGHRTDANARDSSIQWDARVKEATPGAGDLEAQFIFHFTNVTSTELVIHEVSASCGCTTVDVPSTPWRVPPGGRGTIGVTMDLLGRVGTVTKSIFVDTSLGNETLTVRAKVPGGGPKGLAFLSERERNQVLASRDRQRVFRDDCARCHAEPGRGKEGKALYEAVCAICHDSENRASMVPDLKHLPTPLSRVEWEHWIAYSVPDTLMPAFLQSEGGPLTQAQVDSLVSYCSTWAKGH